MLLIEPPIESGWRSGKEKLNGSQSSVIKPLAYLLL
jgi:hypothetical protein